MKDLKFKVHSEDHKEAIIERGSNLGYDNTSIPGEVKYLFFYKNGDTSWSNDHVHYERHYNQEATLDDLYDPNFINKEPEEMTVEQICKELGRTIKIVK